MGLGLFTHSGNTAATSVLSCRNDRATTIPSPVSPIRERESSLWPDLPSEKGWGSSYDPDVLAPRTWLRRLNARSSAAPLIHQASQDLRPCSPLLRIQRRTHLPSCRKLFCDLADRLHIFCEQPTQRPSGKLFGTTPWAWSTNSTKTHDIRSHQRNTKTYTRPSHHDLRWSPSALPPGPRISFQPLGTPHRIRR